MCALEDAMYPHNVAYSNRFDEAVYILTKLAWNSVSIRNKIGLDWLSHITFPEDKPELL